jgi:hypothetical protein
MPEAKTELQNNLQELNQARDELFAVFATPCAEGEDGSHVNLLLGKGPAIVANIYKKVADILTMTYGSVENTLSMYFDKRGLSRYRLKDNAPDIVKSLYADYVKVAYEASKAIESHMRVLKTQAEIAIRKIRESSEKQIESMNKLIEGYNEATSAMHSAGSLLS